MSKSSLLAWYNWTADYGTMSVMSSNGIAFEAEAPISNLKTRQPGQVAIAAGYGNVNFAVEYDTGRPVGVVALLNTNIVTDIGGALMQVTLFDSNGNYGKINAPAVKLNGTGDLMTNLIWLVEDIFETDGIDTTDVVRVEVWIDEDVETGSRDPWTNTVAAAPFRGGTLLTGPVWRPEFGIKMAGHLPGVVDKSPVLRSIGGSTWAAPLTRARQITVDLPSVDESEVEAQPPNMGLRQMGKYCGISRPLLIMPSTTDKQYMHDQSIYGNLTSDLSWSLIERVEGERSFTCSFSVLESM